jgi:excisionase family DNA binding protein
MTKDRPLTRQPDLLTLEEAAAYLRVHSMTMYRLLRSSRLPGVKVGNRWRIRRVDLETYVRGVMQAPRQN